MTIDLPYNFEARPYQMPLFRAYREGIRRFVTVWHRRAGKDLTWFNWLLLRAMERTGSYYYVFPTYAQGKKILWEGRDKDGRRFLDYCPAALVAKRNDSELSLHLANGSVIRVIGADNPDSIVGTNPVGIVFSEYSLQRPTVWDLMRPILAENGGWAAFNFTPRGFNHGYDLYEMARLNPEWFVSRLTVDDTGAVPASVIESERQAGMAEEMIQQEFHVSFEAGQVGAYYGKQMMEAESRIAPLPWSPRLKVNTAWDLGMSDTNAIWFFQVSGKERWFIDYYEGSGEGLSHYAKVLSDKPYAYGQHFFPHDVQVRELGSGKSRLETLSDLGIRGTVVPQHEVLDGIEIVRQVLPSCWFDSVKCKPGVDALRNYTKKYNEERKTYESRPLHDWSSHAADAFRYGAMGYKEPVNHTRPDRRTQQGVDYSGTGY